MGIYRSRPRAACAALLLTACLLLVAGRQVQAGKVFSWSGLPIVGERSDFAPSGTAEFSISGSTLTVTLTNTTTAEIRATGETLSGITFDIGGSTATLTPILAEMPSGQQLVGADAPDPTQTGPFDLSVEWFFKDNLNAGSSAEGPLGELGIGTMGDVNLGADTFGLNDRFDKLDADPGDKDNLFGPEGPNGIETAILGPDVDLTADGFPTQGPLVQGIGPSDGQMVFTFSISGSLSESDFTNVQPLFGTDGATLTPEPSSLALLGLGAMGLLGYSRRRRRRDPKQKS